MAKKRARSDVREQLEDQERQDQPQEVPASAETRVTSRQQAQADIARRRAAHFANYSEGDAAQDAQDNVHAGGNTARTLGPWSSAVELVNARQAAAEQRNNKLLQEQQHQQAAEEQWVPSRDPALGARPSCFVEPLFKVSLQLLVEHIDAVASLWGVPDGIRSQLAAAVCAKRKMTPEVAELFSQQQPSELLLPDCTNLDVPSMLQLLQLLVSPPGSEDSGPGDDRQKHFQPGQCRLERLELGFCGRGFADEAAAALAAAGPLQHLLVLQLGGAYKLSDGGLLQLLRAVPALQELSVPSASRLTGALLLQLPALAPALRCLDLSNCRGLPGPSLAALLPQLAGLRRLVLDGIPEVDAAVLSAVGRCPCLQALSVAMCSGVDDDGLIAWAALSRPGSRSSSSGSSGQGLEELVLDECAAVTDAGLLAVVGACRNLRVLSLRRCSRLTDESLAAAAEKGTLERLCMNAVHAAGPDTLQKLMASNILQELDISFCRELPEGLIGQLVDACSSLRLLKVYGCSQLTARFLHGHSNEALLVAGVHTSCY